MSSFGDKIAPNGIEWCPFRQAFVYQDKQFIRGLTPILKRVFYPLFEYNRANHGLTTGVTVNASGGRHKGLVKGIKIDEEITHIINVERQVSQSKCHPTTWRFFSSLRERGLRPIKAQVVVGSKEINVATRMDVLCMDNDSKTPGYVVLELKTGYLHYYDRHTGNTMPAPLEVLPDSPYNQHQLQVGMTRWLFEKTYPRSQVKNAFVVVLSSDGRVVWIKEMDLIRRHISSIVELIRVKKPKQRGRGRGRGRSK